MASRVKKENVNRTVALRLVRTLLDGCSGCDFDEAEGGLFDHCTKCKHQITTDAYELFVRQGVQIKL